MLREKVEQNLFSAHIHPSRSASVRKSIVYILHSPHGRMLFLMENKRFEDSRYAHWLFMCPRNMQQSKKIWSRTIKLSKCLLPEVTVCSASDASAL